MVCRLQGTALAEYKEASLGDLIEGIVLHGFEGKAEFSKETLEKVAQLKQICGMALDTRDSHRMSDKRNA